MTHLVFVNITLSETVQTISGLAQPLLKLPWKGTSWILNLGSSMKVCENQNKLRPGLWILSILTTYSNICSSPDHQTLPEDKVGYLTQNFLVKPLQFFNSSGSNTAGQIKIFYRGPTRICFPHKITRLIPKSSISIKGSCIQ